MDKPSKPAITRRTRLSATPVIDGMLRADVAAVSLRIDLASDRRIGPGKIELLERIADCGSISAAARQMNMSYLRAWTLVDELDAVFGKSVVKRKSGGSGGGYAKLTRVGQALVTRFRAVERAAARSAHHHLTALQDEIERLDNEPAEVTG